MTMRIYDEYFNSLTVCEEGAQRANRALQVTSRSIPIDSQRSIG